MTDTKFCEQCQEEHPVDTKHWEFRSGVATFCRVGVKFIPGFWPKTRKPTQRQKLGISRERYLIGTQVSQYWPGKGWVYALEQYEHLEKAQGGVCALCKKPPPELGSRGKNGRNRGRLYVDHNHITGKVRGLLCPACNTQLGPLFNNVQLLAAVIKYLEAAQSEQPTLDSSA